MKETLTIYTEQDYFIIETEYTEFSELIINNKNGSYPFTQAAPFKWIISAKQISNYLLSEKEDRMFINYEDKKQIDAENFDIKFNSASSILIDDTPIFLYISLDNKLRFMWNQKPSAKAYYVNSTILSIEPNKNSFAIQMNITSKFSPLSDCQLTVVHRQLDLKFRISASSINSKKRENNCFENLINFLFDPKEVFNSIHPEIELKHYDTAIFDLFFDFDIKAFSLTTPHFRVNYSKNLPAENWTHFSENQMIVLAPYQTTYDNLSFRVGLLKNDVFKYYMNKLENNHTETQNKNIVMVVEYPFKAQDNGFYFFKYLMEKQDKYIPYYLITNDSPDLKNLLPYMDHVIFFKSKKHIQLLFESNYLCHTHSSNYVLPFLSETLTYQKIKIKKIFLQHGIMGVRNLSSLYGKDQHIDQTNKIITSSEREKAQVHEQLHFDNQDIVITGLARFDNLLKKNNLFTSFFVRKKIVIMPTWRKGQENFTDEQFKQTEYFKRFNDLINDNNLKVLAKKKKLSISFYLHTNFQKYSHLFTSPFVRIINEGSQPVQKILKNNGILITDYSSVGLDFAIQNRCVLYYQFENDTIETFKGLNDKILFFPGPIFKTKETLLHILEKKINNNILDKKYQDIVHTQLYSFNDTKACRRIYEVLDTM